MKPRSQGWWIQFMAIEKRKVDTSKGNVGRLLLAGCGVTNV